MAKRRRRTPTLVDLARQLDNLTAQRLAVIGRIQQTAAALGADVVSIGTVTARTGRKGGRPKGYKMSAATKAKLRAAWKRRKAAAGT